MSAHTVNNNGGVALDWAAGHGPVTGALSATTGAFAVATVGTLAHMPPTWALAIGTAGAIGHSASGLRQKLAGRTIGARAASWLLGSGWTTWALATGPLTWTALGSLATIGVAIGASARATGLYEEARELEAIEVAERQIARELSAGRREIAAEWVDRIERVCHLTIRVLAVETWPTGAGFTIDAELPAGGTTYEKIASESARLSADARLPHGCTATASKGIHQGRVLIDVTTVNVLEQEMPYPSNYGPLSILTGIPWGVRTNADEVPVFLREQCALVVGPTGSGKTNMVHTILAGFARATDVLTWVIDLNAGSAGLPWIRTDHAEGKATRPGIDWLAATHDEALLMLDTAIRIAKHRKMAYQDLMSKANTDLLPVSAQIPQIEIVIDEGAEILASADRDHRILARKILEVIRIARAMAIRTVLTALGATGAVLGDLMIRREAKVRVALTGGETEGMDLNKQFPGTRGLKVDQAPYKGSGFLGTPETGVALFKSWRIKPDQIRDIVAATSDRHPRLDAISAKAAGPDYARRWDSTRTAWITNHHSEPSVGSQAAGSGPVGGGLNLTALREDTPPTAAPAPAEAAADGVDAEFERLIAAEFTTDPQPDTPPQTPQEPKTEATGLNLNALRDAGPGWLPNAITAIHAAGPDGMKPAAVADLVGKDRKTVRAALRAAAGRGELVYRDNGPHSVYVHPDHA
ncbi:hypothetical protein [Streptomyces sp. NPDC090036]|uniref:hypothetical protein n=1 Tax=Streptomyces sp. NPDC090036 TaxID=3365926 RepID=UPI00381DB758